jgi:phosphinothricin acetyltransferase
MIRPVKPGDAAAICGIYNYYVKNTAVTFEEKPVSIHEMEGRIRETAAAFPWFVWETEGDLAGYAYAHPWRERSAYRFSAEDSIYLKNGFQGRGIGKQLLAGLLEAMKKTRAHAIVAGITLPNDRSVGLHEKFGFTGIGRFPEIGYKLDTWLDVGYWVLLL